MNRCSSCGYIVPGAWTECRRCGAPVGVATASASKATALAALKAPPPSVRAAPPPDDALLPGASRLETRRDTGPDTMLPLVEPRIIVAPARASKVNGRHVAIGVIAAVFVLGAAFSLIPHGGHHAAAGPTILAPQAPFAGLPTSLAAVVRIEAESSRHTALSVVMSAASPSGTPVTVAQLAGLQPGYQWVPGNQPSTTNTMISVTSAPGEDVIAVSGTNRQICAFGRWKPATGATYVTMDHVETCTASAAPSDGWSTQAGGSAQDLPDETGS